MDTACLVSAGIMQDTACSTFRRPNVWFSVNKNKELEFQSSNKAHSLKNQYQLVLLHADITSNVKYGDKPHTFHWWFSAARTRDFKEKTWCWAYQSCIFKEEHINTVSRMSGTIPLRPLYAFLVQGWGQLQYLFTNRMHQSYLWSFRTKRSHIIKTKHQSYAGHL